MRSEVSLITKRIEISNGITLLVREDHSTPTVSMAAYFLGGRRSETDKNNGISALTKRLMTKGAGEFDSGALADELEYFGISANPFYGLDTAGLKMKTVSRYFDQAFSLFGKMITAPAFTLAEFDKEKHNLIEDIRKEKDNTLAYCRKMCSHLVFEGHPYGLSHMGSIEALENMTIDDIMAFRSMIFSPGRMVLSVVGDINAEETQERVENIFGGFKSDSGLPDIETAVGPIKNVKEGLETSEKQQVAICIGFHAPPVSDEDYCTFHILNQVLSGMGSRLFVELRDKMGLAYSVDSDYSGFVKGGLFEAYILTAFHHKEKARMALLEEVDRLRTRLVSYDELVRAKRCHLGLHDIGLQSNTAVASKIAYCEIVGLGYDFMENYEERIKRITRQKVKRAAEKYLKPQSYAIALLTPATFPKSLQ